MLWTSFHQTVSRNGILNDKPRKENQAIALFLKYGPWSFRRAEIF